MLHRLDFVNANTYTSERIYTELVCMARLKNDVRSINIVEECMAYVLVYEITVLFLRTILNTVIALFWPRARIWLQGVFEVTELLSFIISCLVGSDINIVSSNLEFSIFVSPFLFKMISGRSEFICPCAYSDPWWPFWASINTNALSSFVSWIKFVQGVK